MNFENLKSLAGACPCGQNHTLSTEKVLLESGAVNKICTIIKGLNLSGEALLVCDGNTYKAAGAFVENELEKGNIGYRTLLLDNGRENPAPTIADENSVALLKNNLKNAGYIISIGSGTVTDVCRFVSFSANIPFISVPTAPSMDGYLSTVAAMTFGGRKVTTPARSPAAVIADTDILRKAPQNLVLAGVGDILGKFISLADWKISSLLTNEVYCERIADLTKEAVTTVVSSLESIKNREKQGIENLTRALLVSGLSMQLYGNSRPASGAEHHLSHFWEMFFKCRAGALLPPSSVPPQDKSTTGALLPPSLIPLHGEKVGAATVLIAGIYEKAKTIPDISKHFIPYNKTTKEELEKVFDENADEILKENTPDILSGFKREEIERKWEEITSILEEIPPQNDIINMLFSCGAKLEPDELGIGKNLVKNGLLYCVYVRNRLTFLRILKLFDL